MGWGKRNEGGAILVCFEVNNLIEEMSFEMRSLWPRMKPGGQLKDETSLLVSSSF